MLLGFWAGIFLVASLTAALAQDVTVPVRTGEHAQYTRLAIPMPEDAVWTVRREGRRAFIDVAGLALRFDVSQSFTRIPRTRLSNLRARESQLELVLNCDCALRVAEDLPQLLVLDIVSTPGASAGANSGPDMPDQAVPGRDIAGLAQQAGRGLAAQIRSQPISAANRTDLVAQLFPIRLPDMPADLDTPAGAENPLDARPAMDGAAALGQAISQAVGHGLLAPALPWPPRDRRVEDADDPAPIGPDASVPNDLAWAQISVADSVGRARASLGARTPGDTERTCPARSEYHVGEWHDKVEQSPLIALADLLSETEKPDPAAVEAAAKRLIYWGFGAEAALVLSLAPVQTPAHALLLGLAELVDKPERVIEGRGLQELASCDPNGAFWAALAILPAQLPADFPISSAVQGAGALPAHLRLHLGPYLSQHLLLQGHEAESVALDSVLQRARDIMPARDAGADEASATTTPSKDRQAEEFVSVAIPETLLDTLRIANQSGAALPETTVEEIAAQVFILRGTAQGADMALGFAKALARMQDFSRAFEVATSRDLALPLEHQSLARDALFRELASTQSDQVFLEYLFAHDPWAAPPTPETTARIAARLEALGLNDAARDLELARAALSDAQSAQVARASAEMEQANSVTIPRQAGPASMPDQRVTTPGPQARLGGGAATGSDTNLGDTAAGMQARDTSLGQDQAQPAGGVTGTRAEANADAQPNDTSVRQADPADATLAQGATGPEVDSADSSRPSGEPVPRAAEVAPVTTNAQIARPPDPAPQAPDMAARPEPAGLLASSRQVLSESEAMRARIAQILAGAPE